MDIKEQIAQIFIIARQEGLSYRPAKAKEQVDFDVESVFEILEPMMLTRDEAECLMADGKCDNEITGKKCSQHSCCGATYDSATAKLKAIGEQI